LKHDVILNGVSLLDRERGWIAGEAGTVLSTADGGETWERRETGIDKTLFGVFFADARRGWAVGIDALILVTDDGGLTWTVQHGSADMGGLDQVGFAHAYENPSLYGVAVAGKIGIAVGDMGAIFASEDGGRTWKRRPVPQAWGLRWFADVALDANGEGMIAGAGGSRIRIRGGRFQVPGE